MDQHFNPISNSQPPPVNPIAAPQAQPAPASPVPAPNPVPQPQNFEPMPMTTEVVASIPVRQPGQSPVMATSEPVMQMPAYKSGEAPPAEDELDKILKAVNDRVKAPTTPQPKQKRQLKSALLAGLKKILPKSKTSKPIAAISVTLIVFCLLAATAILAYRQGATSHANGTPGVVGTSSTAANTISSSGGLLVRPNDLDDFSQELQTKMNSLNDTQDFSSSALSDQTLGL